MSSARQTIENISWPQVEKALNYLKENLDEELMSNFSTCVHCGLCARSRHYYLSEQEPSSVPGYKLALVKKLYEEFFFNSEHLELKRLKSVKFDELVEVLFGRCTLCGRCSLLCPMGLNISKAIRIGRGFLASLGLTPDGLSSTVRTAHEKGNNMGISGEDWLDTVSWLQSELQEELQDKKATLPVDKKGAGCYIL